MFASRTVGSLGAPHPESKVESESWGADAVASRSCRAGGDIARWIVEAVASASALKDHLVCAVYPTCRGSDCAEDCKQLARFVAFADSHLKQGNRVVAHCRQGQHRTGVAIYLLLRRLGLSKERCYLKMEQMRPVMHLELLKHTRSRNLDIKAEAIFQGAEFNSEVGILEDSVRSLS